MVFIWFIHVTSLLEIITRQYYTILRLRSNACLELARIHYLADTRLSSSSRLQIGEPGNEAILPCAPFNQKS